MSEVVVAVVSVHWMARRSGGMEGSLMIHGDVDGNIAIVCHVWKCMIDVEAERTVESRK